MKAIENSYLYPKSKNLQKILKDSKFDKSESFDKFRRSNHESSFLSNLYFDMKCASINQVYFHEEIISKLNNAIDLTEEEKQLYGKLYCVINPNDYCEGHKKITHGGFIISVINNLMNKLSLIVNDYKYIYY